MKHIRNVSNRLLVINYMTLPQGRDMPVIDPTLLETPEVKELLAEGSIVIVDVDSKS